MVQRVQTSHLPDPFDPTPVLQGICVYYTDLLWGGVSFAILEDRKWKSAPKEQLPEANIVNGFALNPALNTATRRDATGAEMSSTTATRLPRVLGGELRVAERG